MLLSGQPHARTALLSRKETSEISLDMRLNGSPNRYGSCAQEKSLPLSGIQPGFPGRNIRSLVSAMTEVSRLYPSCESVKCISTCMGVTIDGVWIDNGTNWTL
jgi:hypothetical protein